MSIKDINKEITGKMIQEKKNKGRRLNMIC